MGMREKSGLEVPQFFPGGAELGGQLSELDRQRNQSRKLRGFGGGGSVVWVPLLGTTATSFLADGLPGATVSRVGVVPPGATKSKAEVGLGGLVAAGLVAAVVSVAGGVARLKRPKNRRRGGGGSSASSLQHRVFLGGGVLAEEGGREVLGPGRRDGVDDERAGEIPLAVGSWRMVTISGQHHAFAQKRGPVNKHRPNHEGEKKQVMQTVKPPASGRGSGFGNVFRCEATCDLQD